MLHRDRRIQAAVAFALYLLLACASPEEKFADAVARAEKLAAAGDIEQAILEYRSALQLNTESAEVNEKLGELLLKRNDMTATFYFTEAVRIDPTRTDLAMRLARVLLLNNHVDDAESVIAAALETHPDSAVVLNTQAEMFLYRNDADRALEAATRATELAPDDARSWYQLGRVYQAQIRIANVKQVPPDAEHRLAAVAAFERADSIENGYVLARVELARMLGLRQSTYGDAKEAFTDAVELAKAKNDPTLHLVAAEAAEEFAVKSDDRTMKIWALREMLEADESRLDLWMRLVELGAGMPTIQVQIFEELLEKRPDDVSAHLAFANHLSALGQVKQAIKHVEGVIDRELGSPLPWEQLVRLQMLRGRLAKARASYVRMSDEFPNDPVTRRTEARIAIVEGRPNDAIEILRMLEIDSQHYEVQRLLALAEYRLGNLPEAADAIDRALSMQDGFSAQAMRLKARIHHDSQQWRPTLRALASMRKQGIEIPAAEQLMGARALYGLGRSEDGREVIEKLLAGDDPPTEAAVEFARREGPTYPLRASRYLGSALKRDPNDPDSLEQLVAIQLRTRKPLSALRLIDRAIKSGQAKPATLLLRARVLTKAGELDRAEADALRAFEADPSLPGGVELLYAIYKAQGRLDEARASFEEAEAAGVLHSGARLLLCRIYQRQGDTQRARTMLERVLREDPGAIGAKNDLAYLLASKNTDLDRAEKLAESAHRAMLSSPNTADTLGFVYLRKGLHEEALQQFRHAIALNAERPGDIAPTLHYHLGLTLHALDRNDEAVDAFQKALALDSDFPEAGDARLQLEKAQQGRSNPSSTS